MTRRTQRWASACRLSAAAAGIALLLASSASASTQSIGFSDTVWGNPAVSHTVSLAAMAQSGARYWRTPVNWQYYEPVQGSYSTPYLQYLYDEYTQMRANGQTPIFTVMGTPYWALTPAGRGAAKGAFLCADNANATQCFAPPDVRDATIAQHWKTFLATLAYVMPNAVFEIWNEPNIDWFWMQPQDPALYGLMLNTGGEAIHAANPATKVLSGSVNNYGGSDTTANTGFKSFLAQMYAATPKSSFDALGYHTYPCNFVATASGWTTQVAGDTAAVRAARNAAGDQAKPLWLTETGASTGGPSAGNCGTFFTEAQQGPALSAVMSWASSSNTTNQDLPVVLLYSMFDSQIRSLIGVSNGQPEGEFGLIAYARNASNGAIVTKMKPGYAGVVCAILHTCRQVTLLHRRAARPIRSTPQPRRR